MVWYLCIHLEAQISSGCTQALVTESTFQFKALTMPFNIVLTSAVSMIWKKKNTSAKLTSLSEMLNEKLNLASIYPWV